MAVEVTLLPGTNANNINTNFQRVKDALQEVVGREGDLPNHMNADLDMNSNDILNVDSIDLQRIVVDGEEFDLRQMRGWAPVFSAVEYNGTVVMKLIDYVGGQGIKPTEYIGWYVGSTGYVQNINQATGFGSSGVTDGDKGDVDVSGSGSEWEVVNAFGLDGLATQEQAEDQDEISASTTKTVNVLRMLQGIRAALKNDGLITPHHFGGKGDGSDERAIIQECIDTAETEGGDILIPQGDWGLSDETRAEGSACLFLNGTSHLYGQGRWSRLIPLSGVAAGSDTIRVRPLSTENAAGFTIDNLFMGGIGNPRRQGRHGIHLDTMASGINLAKPIFSRLYISQSYHDATSTTLPNTGRAIYHQNDVSFNTNGGVYGAVIENCRGLGGGVLMIQTGDSNTIRQCIISGINNPSLNLFCVGARISLVGDGIIGGAGFLVLEDLNITTEAGAFVISNGIDIHLNRVFCEHLSADAGIPFTRTDTTTGRALGIIDGPGSTMVGGSIRNCRFSAATGASTLVTTNLYMRNTSGWTLDRNTWYPGKSSGALGIELDTTANDTIITRQAFPSAGFAVADRIVDKGNRNLFNSRVQLTLTADFTAVSSYTPYVAKSDDGTVHLTGFLNGSSPSNKTITTLPAGFRPQTPLFVSVKADDGTSGVNGALQINTDGTVVYQGDAAATRVSITCSFRIMNDLVMNS